MMQIGKHPREGFGTLTLIAIIVAILLVTGIGQALWRHSTQLGAYCRDAMLDLGFNPGLDMCDAIGQSIVGFQRYLEHQVGASRFGDSMNLEEFSGHIARKFASAQIGFSSPQLSQWINPSMLSNPSFNWQGASYADRLSMALTTGAQGQQLFQRGDTNAGLQFMHSSASMGDVGLLSQLQLGSAYARGTGNVAADPARASHYYGQALQSLNSLQRSPNPESKQLLHSLPVPADSLQSQLQSILKQ